MVAKHDALFYIFKGKFPKHQYFNLKKYLYRQKLYY